MAYPVAQFMKIGAVIIDLLTLWKLWHIPVKLFRQAFALCNIDNAIAFQKRNALRVALFCACGQVFFPSLSD